MGDQGGWGDTEACVSVGDRNGDQCLYVYEWVFKNGLPLPFLPVYISF